MGIQVALRTAVVLGAVLVGGVAHAGSDPAAAAGTVPAPSAPIPGAAAAGPVDPRPVGGPIPRSPIPARLERVRAPTGAGTSRWPAATTLGRTRRVHQRDARLHPGSRRAPLAREPAPPAIAAPAPPGRASAPPPSPASLRSAPRELSRRASPGRADPRVTAPPLRIREATGADAAAICRIYNQGIQDRVATLETEERTPEERAAWLGGARTASPRAGRRGRRRPSWAGRASTSSTRGARTSTSRISRSTSSGTRGGAASGGSSSRRSSRGRSSSATTSSSSRPSRGTRRACAPTARAGFREVGIYREQGRLDGRWVDTIVMEKILEGPNAH